MHPESSQPVRLEWKELAPPEWRSRGDGFMRVVTYQAIRAPALKAGWHSLDLPGIRLVLVRGSVPIFDPATMQVRISGDNPPTLEYQLLKPLATEPSPEGVFAVFMSEPAEPGVRLSRLQYAIGFCAAAFGRAMLYARVSDFEVNLKTGEGRFQGSVFENLAFFDDAKVAKEDLETGRQMAQHVADLAEPVKRRVELSLRWYGQSHDVAGTDAFLRAWIALESLTMQGSADIRPLVSHLARASNWSEQDVRRRMHVGRMADLRHAVVHLGLLDETLGAAVDHVRALYRDAVYGSLGVSWHGFAERTAPDALAYALRVRGRVRGSTHAL